MRTELENIADPGDRSCGVGLEQPLLQTLGGIAENHMIDLGQREPGDLNRRIQQDQLFKLDLKRVKIPLSLFRQAIDRQPEDTLFVYAQMLDADARDSIEAQLPRRLVAYFAVNELVATTDKKRITKTEETDRGSDLTHVNRIEFAEFSGGESKLFKSNVGAGACRCALGARSKPPSAPGLHVGRGSSASTDQ
jgi:hypothetical protein